ncbi:hypothetical protein PPL_02959 [Heterostelium album PN500]|uniref:Uncharacterized protein n=1 Tax=Heterostelium pallidum (strain ATCC 26659 / Pp 5 / PN500) TaxID=670386 RepID=D3B3J1_HETP5|nr:hypothetical protein PPL_02959 [Heterostelium album PN500]EFA83889.1 hypothetical protein PPL_02959 [Heterostelium album PN500]|eukprot:XP_020436006.1 hypothetical protein PPL_02959 [Heterostelium album PN500]
MTNIKMVLYLPLPKEVAAKSSSNRRSSRIELNSGGANVDFGRKFRCLWLFNYNFCIFNNTTN